MKPIRCSYASVAAVIGMLVLASPGQAANDIEQQIIDRIKPIGQACIEGDETCAPKVARRDDAIPRSGQEVYDTRCTSCHGAGINGAPRLGIAEDWSPRMVQGQEAMLNNALNGVGGMPPALGTCADCSVEEIQATIEFMTQGL